MGKLKTYLRLLGLASFLAFGLAPVTHQGEVSAQNAGYEERAFDANRLDGYRGDERFHYEREQPKAPKRKKKKRRRRERTTVDRMPDWDGPRGDFSGAVKAIFWVLIIGGGIFLIMQILKVNFRGLIKKKSDTAKVVTDIVTPIEEDITKMQFDDLLQQAIDAGRYRYAVRLLYLSSLRQLTDRHLIAWRQEKTNHDYLRELKDGTLRPLFGDVTLLFEYIWYGEFPVNKDHFNVAQGSFIRFEQELRQKDAV